MARRRRHPSLIPLSHDHREALGLAFRLHHPSPPGPVTAMTPASTPESRCAETLAFFTRHLVPHFRAEEDVLFPFLRTHLPAGVALLDALVADHRRFQALRDAVAAARDDAARAPALTAFADLLEAHVRCEERELFEAFPDGVPQDETQRLGDAIRAAIGR
jgi:hemerythrin superfamily protein